MDTRSGDWWKSRVGGIVECVVCGIQVEQIKKRLVIQASNMESKYSCKPCGYSTHDLTKFTRHKQTKKHRREIEDDEQKNEQLDEQSDEQPDNVIICRYCNKVIKHKYNIKRHNKRCKLKKAHDHNLVITTLTKERDDAIKQTQTVETENKELRAMIKNLTNLVIKNN